jgi:hypothetical protein
MASARRRLDRVCPVTRADVQHALAYPGTGQVENDLALEALGRARQSRCTPPRVALRRDRIGNAMRRLTAS